MVAIPGGEPLIHKDIGEIVSGIVARKKVRLAVHQRAAAGKEARSVRTVAVPVFLGASRWPQGPSRQVRFPGWRVRPRSVGDQRRQGARLRRQRQRHDLRRPCGRGHRGLSRFRQVSSASASPFRRAMPMSGRPTRSISSSRRKTKELFRRVFALGKGKGWNLVHSGLFLDFLAGNQTYHCTPWGMPTRNIFGWQKPCYLLGEGYAKSFKELMETTDWDTYGTGQYEKCAELHGPLRLRADGGRCHLGATAEGAAGGACAACGRQGRWRRKSTSTASARPSTSFHATWRRCLSRSAATRPRRPGKALGTSDVGAPPAVEIDPGPSVGSWCRVAASATHDSHRRRCAIRRVATMAAGGKARSDGSVMTRKAANGMPVSAAIRAAMWLSISTAAAPVSAQQPLALAHATRRLPSRRCRRTPHGERRGVRSARWRSDLHQRLSPSLVCRYAHDRP